jgi:hypothetical protein
MSAFGGRAVAIQDPQVGAASSLVFSDPLLQCDSSGFAAAPYAIAAWMGDLSGCGDVKQSQRNEVCRPP